MEQYGGAHVQYVDEVDLVEQHGDVQYGGEVDLVGSMLQELLVVITVAQVRTCPLLTLHAHLPVS